MSDPPILIPYCRQSLARLGETRETSLSLAAQEAVIRDWGEANGFVVQDAIRDHDVKGEDPARPGLREIETRAQSGMTIAAYKWDRLARDVPLQETLVRRLQARNVQVISVTEPSTRLTRVIYGAVNEEFRDALSERMQGIRKAQAQRGQYIGSHCPYGYARASTRVTPMPDGQHITRPSGALAPDETAAPIIHEAYQRIANGEPVYRVVADFAARGVPTMRGGSWQVTTLRRILTNPVYAGDVTYRGEVVATGAHQPLVSRDLWDRANTILTRPTIRRKRHEETSWLEGYIEHICGRRMYLMALSNHRDHMKYSAHFGCATAYQAIKCGQDRRHISRRKAESAARECLIADLSSIQTLEIAVSDADAHAGGGEATIARQRLATRRVAAETRYDRARLAWLNGIDPVEQLQDEQTRRDVVLATVDAELAMLPAAPDPAVYREIDGMLTTIAEVINTLDDAQLTPLLVVIGIVVVAPNGVSIRYHPGYRDFIPSPRLAVIR